MSYMLDSFKNWIKNKKRDDGTYYSDETISNYITSLKKHANKLTDISLENCDLFNIDTLAEFDEAPFTTISAIAHTRAASLRE